MFSIFKVKVSLYKVLLEDQYWIFFFFYLGFLSRNSRFTEQQGKGGGYFFKLTAILEPGTFGFRAQISNHLATRPN